MSNWRPRSFRELWHGDPARRGTPSQRFCRLMVLIVMVEGVHSMFGWMPYDTGLLVLFLVMIAEAHAEGTNL